ncbi:hypothetical protein, partial [Serratia marcescens]|uniref:hypothetical protein n=1 Tax=Serratia marcescens TaxID=615 RepID=UPI002812D146
MILALCCIRRATAGIAARADYPGWPTVTSNRDAVRTKGKRQAAFHQYINKQAAVRRPVGLTQIQPGGDVGNLAAPARLQRRFLVL